MRAFTSTRPELRHTDPTPWVADNGERTTYAGWSPLYTFAPRPECVPTTTNPVNPILALYRESTDPQGEYAGPDSPGEFLVQLARHWAQWQSERIGTFPMDYRDPSGPADRAYSEESGADSAYWDIDDLIRRSFEERGWNTEDDEPDENSANGWTYSHRDDVLDHADYVQDIIAHATAVLIRLYNAYAERG